MSISKTLTLTLLLVLVAAPVAAQHVGLEDSGGDRRAAPPRGVLPQPSLEVIVEATFDAPIQLPGAIPGPDGIQVFPVDVGPWDVSGWDEVSFLSLGLENEQPRLSLCELLWATASEGPFFSADMEFNIEAYLPDVSTTGPVAKLFTFGIQAPWLKLRCADATEDGLLIVYLQLVLRR